VLGRPLEYFNPSGRRALESPDYPDDPALQVEQVLTTGRTANGVYGLKMFPNQLERTLPAAAIFDVLPNLHFVRLIRLDVLGQAISWARALMTGQYRGTQTANGPAIYDGPLISRCLSEIVCANADWDIYFARRGISPLRLYYEDVEIDGGAAVKAIAKLMNVDDAQPLPSRVSVTTQRDDLSATWRRAFVAEYGAPNTFHRVSAPDIGLSGS